jgi:deoxycytidine triphosphate deaminase
VIKLLSIVDLKNEIGTNIYVYPVHIESIKSNSIDLHVSKFAWSLATKKSIVTDGYVVIDPNDTALIYTEESIYVSNHIGGSYHSKVTLVSQGAGHIGTTLDAQYLGCSIIAIHNHSNQKLKLKVGSEFVTVQFWYLNSPDYKDTISHDNEPGHPRMLNGFDDVNSYIEWRDKNTWTTRKKDLYLKMTESEEYKLCKKEYQEELDMFNRAKIKSRTKHYMVIIGCLLIFLVLLCIPSYIIDFGKVSEVLKNLSERVFFQVALSIITTYIILDLKNR